MKYFIATIIFFGFTSLVVADITPPTCEERPTRRDCVKVEDPNATPPKHTIKQNKPQQPIVKPKPRPKPKSN